MSRAMATSILRKFSAWRSSLDAKLILESFVTPSTRNATSCPNSRSMSSVVASVSSTTSCRRPAQTLAVSRRRSVMMPATLAGWLKYGSPLLRVCPLCARCPYA